MKKTVSAVCAAILVLMLLVPCFGSAEEYYTPGRIAVPETGLPFSMKTEQGSGKLEYEAVLDGSFMEQLEVEFEKDDVEYEVLYDILGNVVRAECENGNSEIYYNGTTWTDGNGNQTTGPDLSFMKKYYNDFQLEPQEIYKNNTLGVVGLSLREMDKNLTDKWYHILPVDLTKEGTFRYKLVSGNLFYMGYCDVTIADGKVTVDYSIPEGVELHPEKQCLAWFTALDEITMAFLNNPVSNFRFGQPADIQKDLGGKDVALMFICNRISFMLPLAGSYYYPKRFYYNNPDLKAYRKELTALLDKMN